MMEMMNLQKMIAEKRITRRQWTGTDAQGRSTACLLAAMHPPCGTKKSASVCPASLMPQWMAELTLWIDDSPSDGRWWSIVERYGAIAQRFPELDEKRWDRASYRVGAAILRIAMPAADDEWGCRRAVAGMLAYYETAVATGEIDVLAKAKWAAAAAVASADTARAEQAARSKWAAAVTKATWLADMARAERATRTARAVGVARATEWVMVQAADAAAGAAWVAARAERADLICDAVLDAIEQELTAEKGRSA